MIFFSPEASSRRKSSKLPAMLASQSSECKETENKEKVVGERWFRDVVMLGIRVHDGKIEALLGYEMS